jgi:serine/threonine-protein kinase
VSDLLTRLQAALHGRYRVERELGQGGMATVYLAQDLRHDREVAIKVLRPELAASLGAERFLREIRVAARLQHPHILPLFDSGETDGLLFYVMPFVRGESLRSRMQREKQLSITDALRIAREVADALAFAHTAGVIHRDIKPENILLSGEHAVVSDFGIARAINEAGGQSLTSAGIAVGTPLYMSPEQSTGEQDIDGRSDIYSLGCVLYEMLAGEPPFHGPTTESIVHQHLTATAIPVESRRPSVPAATSGIVRRALAKTPADRFSGAAQLADALTHATGAFEASSAAQAPRGRRVGALAAAAVGLGLLGVILLLLLRRPGAASVDAASGSETPSVAILRCSSPEGSGVDAFLSDGITQEIISRLAQVPDLKVISGSSVLPLARSGLTTRQIADTLGVRFVLECSVSQRADQVRVFGQLVDARTSAVKWAKPFERGATDQAVMEDEIARDVVGALTAQGGALRPQTAASRTSVPGAAQALLEGNYLLHRRSPEAIRGAVAAYGRAVALDSGFAPAYAALGSAYGLSLTYMTDLGASPYVVYARGLVLTTRAIALDSTLAEAYAARSYIMTKAFGPSEPIAADFRAALRYRPNSADVHGWYAHFLSREGRHTEALAEAERAIALDPIAPGRRVGFALDAISAARYDLALRESEHATALEPDLSSARIYGAVSALLLGDAGRCAAQRPLRSVLALCLHTLGRAAEARGIADSVERVFNEAGGMENAVRARDLASFHAWTGDARRATLWLQRAFELSPNAIDFRIVGSKLFDPVRKDPGFAEAYRGIQSDVWARTEAARDRMTVSAALGHP